MNAPTDPLQRRKIRAIAAVFGLNLIFGMLLVTTYPGLAAPDAAPALAEELRASPLNIAHQIAVLLACFAWLQYDSRQLDIRRPWWLNLGIVMLTSVFVPYYLYKTRPQGRRGQAILSFFGVVFGGIVAMMLGMVVALSLRGAAPVQG
ncbi:MAG TPA: hypothetical protein VGC30_08055 [Dokdonella sp.]